MSFWSWLRRKPPTPIQRAASPHRIDVVPSTAPFYGPGALFQPQSNVLLHESIGIPDAATRAIANRIATLEPEVYVERRIDANTSEDEILDDHPLKQLILKPHPNFSFSQTFRLLGQYLVTVGDAYLQKVGDPLRVTELHVIPPTMVMPLVADNLIRAYRVTDANGRQVDYTASTFVRIWMPDPENIWRGEGYLGPSGISADAHKFMGQHLRTHFQNDAVPKAVLEAQEGAESWTPEELETFYQLWREAYNQRTGHRTGLPALTPIGYKIVELAMQNGRDFTPLLKYFQDELLLSYGVPRSVLGQVVAGDRSSAETNQYIFDRYAVLPLTHIIEDALNTQLAPEFDEKVKFRFRPFVSDDKEYTLKQEKQDLELKVRSPNQVREDRGLNSVEWGEYPVGQMQDVPYHAEEPDEKGLTETASEPDPTPDEEARAERLLHLRVRQHFQARRRSRRPAA